MIVQAVYGDGVITENSNLTEEEATRLSMELIANPMAEYERVRLLKDDGSVVFDQRMNQ